MGMPASATLHAFCIYFEVRVRQGLARFRARFTYTVNAGRKLHISGA